MDSKEIRRLYEAAKFSLPVTESNPKKSDRGWIGEWMGASGYNGWYTEPDTNLLALATYLVNNSLQIADIIESLEARVKELEDRNGVLEVRNRVLLNRSHMALVPPQEQTNE